MTDYSMGMQRPPLEVGTRLGEAFSGVFSNFFPMMIIAAIPASLGQAMSIAVTPLEAMNPFLAFSDPFRAAELQEEISMEAQILVTIVGFLLWGFAAAATVHGAYQARTHGSVSISAAYSATFRQAVPVLICSFVVLICAYVGLFLLIVPGLYIAALWFVVVPAVVVEKQGPAAFGRSASLTQDYRWPLVGLMLLYFLILLLIGLLSVLVILAAGLLASMYGNMAGGIVFVALGTIFTAFTYALGGALTASVYMRLRDIKEGFSVDNLRDVFS